MKIRKLKIQDYDDVSKLWKNCNLPIGSSDTKEEIQKFIKRNPDTCLVGMYKNRIISSVLGGFDGRRGFIHHLAVDPKYQSQGYGFTILSNLEEIFKSKGITKYHLFIKKDNIDVVNFYRKLGCELREDIVMMSKYVK